MTRLLLPLIAVALLSLAFAPAPLPRRENPVRETGKLEGVWERISPDRSMRLEFSPDRVSYGGMMYRLTTNTRGRPWTYDLADERGVAVQYLGLYRVEGDILTFCYHPVGRGRPTGFEGPGKGTWTEIYQRKK